MLISVTILARVKQIFQPDEKLSNRLLSHHLFVPHELSQQFISRHFLTISFHIFQA